VIKILIYFSSLKCVSLASKSTFGSLFCYSRYFI